MKKIMINVIAVLFFLTACNNKTKVEQTVELIPVDIKIERFDKLFFETKPNNLNELKNKFPFFFPSSVNDSVWLKKMKDPLWRELYSEVQNKYPNIEPLRENLNLLLKYTKYYFPETKTPKVITVISEMDYNNKVIYADSLLIISLELYLGKAHKFYQFPKYIKQNFEENQILPDIVSSFLLKKNIINSDKSLLSQMIYHGKQLYVKDKLLLDYTDANKIGYTSDQIKWCQENESYIWRYFLEKEMIYDTDPKLNNRFINPAPFSKFYLEIDNESPGRIGTWIGWQIVRSFMENNEVTLPELLKMNAKEIFVKSKYKPKKNVE